MAGSAKNITICHQSRSSVNYKVECHQALTSRESKMWLFCAIAIQLLRLLANVQGLALQEEDTHEENHSSVENASALLNEKH
eukprot:2635418-Ditylum_brightwellii.AAC.1